MELRGDLAIGQAAPTKHNRDLNSDICERDMEGDGRRSPKAGHVSPALPATHYKDQPTRPHHKRRNLSPRTRPTTLRDSRRTPTPIRWPHLAPARPSATESSNIMATNERQMQTRMPKNHVAKNTHKQPTTSRRHVERSRRGGRKS